jgi:hypothetical protein
MRWAVHVTGTETMRNSYTTLTGIPENERSLGRHKNKWKDIKMNHKEIGREEVQWINMTEAGVNCGLL